MTPLIPFYSDIDDMQVKSTTASTLFTISEPNDITTVAPDKEVDHEDVDLFTANIRKNRLSQMGRSSYGPQKLHRKK